MACEVFKIVNKLSTEYIQDMINIKTSTYDFRDERKANIPRVNTTRYGLRSFRPEAPNLRNVSFTERNQISLTYCDEIKKIALSSQTVESRAKI